jgi:hypothetical protein
MQGKRHTSTLLVGMQISATLVEISIEVHQNCKNKTTIGSNNTTPGHVTEVMQARTQ